MTGRSGAGAISDHQCLLFYAQFFSIPYRLPPTGTNQLLHSILLYSILFYSTLRCSFCSGYNKHRYLNIIIFQQPW